MLWEPGEDCGLISNTTSSLPVLLVLWPCLTFWFSPLVFDISPIIISFIIIITCPLPPHTSPLKGLFTLTLLLRARLGDPLGAWDQLMFQASQGLH